MTTSRLLTAVGTAMVVLVTGGCGVLKKKQSVLDREDAEAQAAASASASAQAVTSNSAAAANEVARARARASTAAENAKINAARATFITKAAKDCHIRPADYHPATPRELYEKCAGLVYDGLVAPGQFQDPDEVEKKGLRTIDGCRFFLEAYVTSAGVKTRFRCNYDPTTGIVAHKEI